STGPRPRHASGRRVRSQLRHFLVKGSVMSGRNDTALIDSQCIAQLEPARCRRRSRALSTLFEAVACNLNGDRIDGTPQSSTGLNGDARHYRFPAFQLNGQKGGEPFALASRERSLVVRDRLAALLPAADIDLFYLRLAAGWSQAEVARELG